jgi:hypothetical protein
MRIADGEPDAGKLARPVRREGDAPSYLLRRRWVRSLPYTVRYTATNPARFERLWR